jgi:hypothetical protein
MKGLEVTRGVFEAILKCREWNKLIVFDKDHNVMIDLKKYSARGSYLPIESEYQSYIVGFLFMKELYDCPYRTQEDRVYVYPKQEKRKSQKWVKERRPVMRQIIDIVTKPESSIAEDFEYTEEWVLKDVN